MVTDRLHLRNLGLAAAAILLLACTCCSGEDTTPAPIPDRARVEDRSSKPLAPEPQAQPQTVQKLREETAPPKQSPEELRVRISRLLPLLSSELDYDEHQKAARELKEILMQGPELISEIKDKHKEVKDPQVRKRLEVSLKCICAEVLGEMRDSGAIESLVETMKSSNHTEVLQSAALAIGNIGGQAGYKALRELAVFGDSENVRRYAVAGLARIDSKESFDLLVETLAENSAGQIRAEAAKGLGESGKPQALEPLVKALKNDKSQYVRWWIAHVLWKVKTPEAVDVLIRTLQTDSAVVVRAACAESLGYTGDPRAVQPLVEALLSNHPKVSIHASLALTEFDQKLVKAKLKTVQKEIPTQKRQHPDEETMDLSLLLAWLGSKEHLKVAKEYEPAQEIWGEPGGRAERGHSFEDNLRLDYLKYIEAMSGDVKALRVLQRGTHVIRDYYLPLMKSVISRMPQGFPGYDPNSDLPTREKQVESISLWFRKHEKQLTWDVDKQRYYLRAQDKEQKKE